MASRIENQRGAGVATAQFKVGDGATFVLHTDTQAGTIVSVSKNGKRVTWQRDVAIRTTVPEFVQGGFAGHCTNQREIDYTYKRDPNGVKQAFSLRANGKWKATGQAATSPGLSLSPGRHEFYDYNF